MNAFTIVDYELPATRTETMIDEYPDNEIVKFVYEQYEGPRDSFGGGVSSINAYDLLEFFDYSPHKLNRSIKIGLKRAKELCAWCEKKIKEEEIY